jgi:hypothetical protein
MGAKTPLLSEVKKARGSSPIVFKEELSGFVSDWTCPLLAMLLYDTFIPNLLSVRLKLLPR